MNRFAKLTGPVLLSCALAACGTAAAKPTTATPSKASKATPPAAAQVHSPASSATITIKGFAFGAPVTVKPGEKIAVHNADAEAHSVTADSGGAFNVTVPPSGTLTLTAPSRPGTYAFHCMFHGNMHGSLRVG